MKTSEIATLKTWITESSSIVFFGGAGVSTESGIPDFRSVDGLYHQKFDYPPETILSHSFFYSHTEEFYRFYREKMLPLSEIAGRLLSRTAPATEGAAFQIHRRGRQAPGEEFLHSAAFSAPAWQFC